MTEFWLIAVVLALIAAAFVLIPVLLLRRQPVSEDRDQVNVSIYSERLAELEESFSDGGLGEQEYASLKAELQKTLLQDAGPAKVDAPREQATSRTVPVVISVLVPLVAILLYADFGFSWGQLEDFRLASALRNPVDQPSLERDLDRLEAQLSSQPDNDRGWYLLGQSSMELERYRAATRAFGHLADRYPGDPDLASLVAQARFMEAGRQMTPEVETAIATALQLNPHNTTMLEIRGMHAFQTGDTAASLTWFRKALATGVEGERAELLQSAIRRVEQVAAEQGVDVSAAPDAPVVSRRSIRVDVRLAEGIVRPADETVFVFARAVAGPPMPLAVQRLKVAELPATITLDESMGMMAGMGLANFDAVEVVARVSSTGGVARTKGDVEAISGVIDLTTTPETVELLISDQI